MTAPPRPFRVTRNTAARPREGSFLFATFSLDKQRKSRRRTPIPRVHALAKGGLHSVEIIFTPNLPAASESLSESLPSVMMPVTLSRVENR